MKRTLIITAHPSSIGFTHQIAKHYAQAIKNNNGTVEILNLYAPENQQSFLQFETKEKKWPQEKLQLMHQKISDANELVFSFPVWWGDAPAVMKNWLDYNFSSGFAFEYESKGVKKLLKGKRAKIIATSDAPGFVYGFLLSPMRIMWSQLRLSFCGIKVTHFKVYGKMRKRDKESRQKILKEIEKLALK